jgi:tetratricopeptide (TPR) repeat protein
MATKLGGRRDALEALRLSLERGDRSQVVLALLDSTCCCSDDLQLALEYATRASEFTPFPHRLDFLAEALNLVSVFSFLLGRYDEALAKAQEVLKLDASHDVSVYAHLALRTIAICAVVQGQIIAGNRTAKWARAARLLGFASAAGTGNYNYRTMMLTALDNALAVLADSIGNERLDQLMAEGSAITRELAISEAFALCG